MEIRPPMIVLAIAEPGRQETARSMSGRLPEDLSVLSAEELRREGAARDRILTPLFRRWPALSEHEHGRLKAVYEERQRVARYLGRVRRRRQSAA